MIAEADIAAVGALIGDRARGAMLNALMGGEAVSAGELARVGGVSPSGATAHLGRLRDGGLVTDEVVGRQRVFRLASPELAEALEALALVAPPVPVRGLRRAGAAEALKRARTCYDHLAGELGVAVTEALVEREILAHDGAGFALTRAGGPWLEQLGPRPGGATAGAAQLRPRMRRLDRAAAARGGIARRRDRDRLLRPRVGAPPARRPRRRGHGRRNGLARAQPGRHLVPLRTA